MREILFRGKGIRGNWHIGLLAHVGNAWYISNKVGIATAYEVIPETIGQYTGLTDKNGRKIFEGDIIKSHGNDSYVIKYGEYIPQNYCLARYYDKPTIGFYAYDGERCFQLSTNSRCYEVIGNIHDNPELAEGLL